MKQISLIAALVIINAARSQNLLGFSSFESAYRGDTRDIQNVNRRQRRENGIFKRQTSDQGGDFVFPDEYQVRLHATTFSPSNPWLSTTKPSSQEVFTLDLMSSLG
jgi:hypothetical protein